MGYLPHIERRITAIRPEHKVNIRVRLLTPANGVLSKHAVRAHPSSGECGGMPSVDLYLDADGGKLTAG